MEPYSRASRASEISLFVDTSTCAETPNNLSFLFFSFLFSPNIAAFFEEVQPKLQRPSVQREPLTATPTASFHAHLQSYSPAACRYSVFVVAPVKVSTELPVEFNGCILSVVARTHQCILIVVWEAAVTWVVVVPDHTSATDACYFGEDQVAEPNSLHMSREKFPNLKRAALV
ncbi:hypothetical protein WN944_024409 [Citrus x changshan-huyou]|uniref:Uncharacterized protein n=1 Tax=Citrus x changshan-huyou TaxID=2935761 RepID=A0AAP0LNI8_9ROSI